MTQEQNPEIKRAYVRSTFCDDCPLKGEATGQLEGMMTVEYGVGLNKIGAAGAVYDEAGNYSSLIDLPYQRILQQAPESFVPDVNSPKYWPDHLPGLVIAQSYLFQEIAKCKEPVVEQSRILKRNTKRCAVLHNEMMPRRARKILKTSIKLQKTREQ